jgi:hypothetical protein
VFFLPQEHSSGRCIIDPEGHGKARIGDGGTGCPIGELTLKGDSSGTAPAVRVSRVITTNAIAMIVR